MFMAMWGGKERLDKQEYIRGTVEVAIVSGQVTEIRSGWFRHVSRRPQEHDLTQIGPTGYGTSRIEKKKTTKTEYKVDGCCGRDLKWWTR